MNIGQPTIACSTQGRPQTRGHSAAPVSFSSTGTDMCAQQPLSAAPVSTAGTKLVAQSYDGASVMSGVKGGVQKLVSDSVGRYIIYIHCFAHRLHLVVLEVLKASNHVGWIIDVCEHLYNFFRRYAVAHEHHVTGGQTLKRIMPQRW